MLGEWSSGVVWCAIVCRDVCARDKGTMQDVKSIRVNSFRALLVMCCAAGFGRSVLWSELCEEHAFSCNRALSHVLMQAYSRRGCSSTRSSPGFALAVFELLLRVLLNLPPPLQSV